MYVLLRCSNEAKSRYVLRHNIFLVVLYNKHIKVKKGNVLFLFVLIASKLT